MTVSFDDLQAALGDRYRIERELGRGGMATVYLAADRSLERRVALKVLHRELAHALGPERFQQEIRTAARLQHPHILPLFESGVAGDRLWYTMPYVQGPTLRQRLLQEKQLPIEDAVRIGTQVLSALEYAPRHGGIHILWILLRGRVAERMNQRSWPLSRSRGSWECGARLTPSSSHT